VKHKALDGKESYEEGEQVVKICANCGQTVKNTAKFCKYCGVKITASAPRAPAVQPTKPATPKTAVKPHPVTEVPADVLAQLDARSSLTELQAEEKAILEELEKLEAELEQGDRSIAELEKEIKPLKKKIKTLKGKETKLKAKVKPFSFEKSGKERELWRDRAENLEELREKGEVRESVYNRLREEYETNRAKADAEFQEQVLMAREWLAILKGQYTATRDELSMLEARRSVGEIKEKQFKTKKLKLEKRARMLGHHVEVLEEILRNF
jgi:predicted nuclease with TOPRIM domain